MNFSSLDSVSSLYQQTQYYFVMASVIEDAETYQQSGLIVPSFNLENSNDLVPLTNPASDITTLRRTSTLGNVSRGELIFHKFD